MRKLDDAFARAVDGRSGMSTADPEAFVLPHPRRAGWFVVPRAWGPDVAGTGSYIELLPGGLGIHRSHLPILAQRYDIVRPFLVSPVADLAARERFDAEVAHTGKKLRPYQHAAREFALAREGVLIADQMRLGKAQPLNAKVLTPAGWRSIGDLIVGDLIIDPDGGSATVTDTFQQGVKPIYRITMCDGASTECCDEHLWLVLSPDMRYRKAAGKVRALKDFKDDLWQVTRTRSWGSGNRKQFFPACMPVVFVKTPPLPIDPYLLGALLGNGSFVQSSPIFSSADPTVVAYVAAGVTRFGLTAKYKSGVDHCLTGPLGQPNRLINVLRDIELWNHKPSEKFIPEIYLRASVEDRLALLRGLMDTDGDITVISSTTFNTSSPQLADGVVDLVRSLGGFASVGMRPKPIYTYKGEKRVGLPSYHLHIRIPMCPFLSTRKAERWRLGYLTRGVESVEYVGEKEAVCIAVSSKRNLYITDDYIVTHNTASAIAIHDPAAGPLMVVAPLATRDVWMTWMAWRWPNEQPLVLQGRAYDPSVLVGAKLIFCHYDVMSAWQSVAMSMGQRLGTLVFDEAHILSNRKAKRTQAAMLLANRATKVLALTGTPLWNRPAGLWPILACIAPGAYGKFGDFAERYCDPQITAWGTRYDGASNVDEFKARMTELMIRRTWVDVLDELPAVERSVEVADVTEEQFYKIEVAAEKLHVAGARRIKVGDIARFRRLLGQFKTDIAVEVAQRVLEGDEPVVVWVWHIAVGATIVKRLIAVGFHVWTISGKNTQDDREVVLRAWRADPRGALVLTIMTGQVGIDLSHARQAVFAEQDFTPATVAQAEMRTFSPLRPMAITYVVVDHPIDRGVVEALQRKCATANTIGVPAAESAIEVIASAFGGQPEDGDIKRLTEAILAADLVEDEDDD